MVSDNISTYHSCDSIERGRSSLCSPKYIRPRIISRGTKHLFPQDAILADSFSRDFYQLPTQDIFFFKSYTLI